MNYNTILFLSLVGAALLLSGSVLAIFNKNKRHNALIHFLIIAGLAMFAVQLVAKWISLQRPPLRTLGETRLWYTFFMGAIGYFSYIRWKYKWLMLLCNAFAMLFLFINLVKPENMDSTLMPALQSVWFVPHVIVYILSYSILGVATAIAAFAIYKSCKNVVTEYENMLMHLVYLGFSLLTLGMTFGAFWAKQAWGHYWTWDPKETWAFLTWLVYLLIIHIQKYKKIEPNKLHWLLVIAFIMVLLCWFGIQYMPVAQNSVHVYS